MTPTAVLPLKISESLYPDPLSPSDLGEEDAWTSKLDFQISHVMGLLYGHREHYLRARQTDSLTKRLVERIDQLINRCWTCETEAALEGIRKHILLLNAEIDTGKIAPAQYPPKPKNRINSHGFLDYHPSAMLRSYPAINIPRTKPRAPAAVTMALTQQSLANLDSLFLLPANQGEISCRNIKRYFPRFAASMSGADPLGCLLSYYKYTPFGRRYEFLGPQAEQTVAELLKPDLEYLLSRLPKLPTLELRD
jgi:hypothetical protein